MAPSTAPTTSRVSVTDLALLVYLGAVWGAAFLFFRVASPEIGPLWTAEIRVAIAGLVLAPFSGRSAPAAARRQPLPILVAGATFAASPFTLPAFAPVRVAACGPARARAVTGRGAEPALPPDRRRRVAPTGSLPRRRRGSGAGLWCGVLPARRGPHRDRPRDHARGRRRPGRGAQLRRRR